MPSLTDIKIRTIVDMEFGEGADPLDYAEEMVHEGVVPAICMHPECDCIMEMEPDAYLGDTECEECGRPTIQGFLCLMGII